MFVYSVWLFCGLCGYYGGLLPWWCWWVFGLTFFVVVLGCDILLLRFWMPCGLLLCGFVGLRSTARFWWFDWLLVGLVLMFPDLGLRVAFGFVTFAGCLWFVWCCCVECWCVLWASRFGYCVLVMFWFGGCFGYCLVCSVVLECWGLVWGGCCFPSCVVLVSWLVILRVGGIFQVFVLVGLNIGGGCGIGFGMVRFRVAGFFGCFRLLWGWCNIDSVNG